LWADAPPGGEYLATIAGSRTPSWGARVEMSALTGVGYRSSCAVATARLDPPPAWRMDSAGRARRRQTVRESPPTRLGRSSGWGNVLPWSEQWYLRPIGLNVILFSGYPGYRSWRSRGARAALETGAVYSHALGRHDSRWCGAATISSCGGCVWRRSCSPRRRVGLDAALVRGGRAPPRRGVWALVVLRGLHRRACRGERPGLRGVPAANGQFAWVAIRVRRTTLPRGRALTKSWAPRFAGKRVSASTGQRRGTGMMVVARHLDHRAVAHAALLTPQGRAIAQFARSSRRQWIRAAARPLRCPAGMCATTGPGRGRWLGQRAGAAAMSTPTPPADLLDAVVRAPHAGVPVWTSEWAATPARRVPCLGPGAETVRRARARGRPTHGAAAWVPARRPRHWRRSTHRRFAT